MIPVDFFGCKREQIVTCSWEQACDRFPFTGITVPDISALNSLSQALLIEEAFSAELAPLWSRQFHEVAGRFKASIQEATTEELMDAGARWAQLAPWDRFDINPMDLAGFLLELQSLVRGPGREKNALVFLIEPSDYLPS